MQTSHFFETYLAPEVAANAPGGGVGGLCGQNNYGNK